MAVGAARGAEPLGTLETASLVEQTTLWSLPDISVNYRLQQHHGPPDGDSVKQIRSRNCVCFDIVMEEYHQQKGGT